MLNVVSGSHLKLRCHPPLLHNFKWFNIKAAIAHYSVIHREVDGMLAKGSVEPLSGFYSNVFVVPKHTGGL